MRAVRYDSYGPPTVLTIVDVDDPTCGENEVLVDVHLVGLNPIDSKVRRGARPVAPMPSGLGREFVGSIVAMGSQVHDLSVGDLVIGTGEGVAQERFAVARNAVMLVPDGLDLEIAASLTVVAQTAWCAVESQRIGPDDCVVVTAAGGSVGFVAAQLAVGRGARVLGTCGERDDDRLRSVGVEPVRYGAGLVERLRQAAPEGVTVVLDHHGPESIEAALELGVPRERINSTSGLADRYMVPAVGRVGLDPTIVGSLAALVQSDALALPVDRVFRFDDVVEAFRHLESRQASGKVLLEILPRPEAHA